MAVIGAVVRAPSFLPAGAFQPEETAMEFTDAPEDSAEPVLLKAPEGAVTVTVGGERLFTLESEQTAAAFLNGLLQTAYDHADKTQYPGAAFVQEVALLMPSPGETVLPLEEAQSLLAADPGLIPVAVTTTAVEEAYTPYETETEKSTLLPTGSRMLKTMGKQGAAITVNQTTAISGEAMAQTETVLEKALWEPVTEQRLTGKYRSSKPEKEPGKTEGADGPEDISLELARPVKASITSNFGTRLGAMHYGVDYACKAGTAVTAPVSGKVIYAAERGEYGYVLEIETENGFTVRLARITGLTVALGDTVESGLTVAAVAETNEEEGKPHVHMEVLYEGVAYNPRQYLD